MQTCGHIFVFVLNVLIRLGFGVFVFHVYKLFLSSEQNGL